MKQRRVLAVYIWRGGALAAAAFWSYVLIDSRGYQQPLSSLDRHISVIGSGLFLVAMGASAFAAYSKPKGGKG